MAIKIKKPKKDKLKKSRKKYYILGYFDDIENNVNSWSVAGLFTNTNDASPYCENDRYFMLPVEMNVIIPRARRQLLFYASIENADFVSLDSIDEDEFKKKLKEI